MRKAMSIVVDGARGDGAKGISLLRGGHLRSGAGQRTQSSNRHRAKRTGKQHSGFCPGAGSAGNGLVAGRSKLPAGSIQRILGIESSPQGCHLLPFRPCSTGLCIQLAGQRIELLHALAVGVDLQQLGVDGDPLRILAQGLDQYLLGLRIPAISHIHVGFGDRIDFVGVDRTRTGHAEVTRFQRHVSRVDALAAGHPEHRIRPETRWTGNRSSKFRLGLLK